MIRKGIIFVLILAAVVVSADGLASLNGRASWFGLPISPRCSLTWATDQGSVSAGYLVGKDFAWPPWTSSWLGFGCRRVNLSSGTNQARLGEVRCPFWIAAVLLASYPAVSFIRGPLRRYRRRKRGLCRKCGYDLTGNVSGICPECAAEVPAP